MGVVRQQIYLQTTVILSVLATTNGRYLSLMRMNSIRELQNYRNFHQFSD
ncbi:hypothetical protein GBAR_LOCUS26858 [Geodia barretti]|uniref:Uncharacterized protein n=1 Tax=Geodia barretti TaxID=519541 RepID=A0AA35TIL4_GEOBA|nr:hypothetical protein GBAR_LOCUS26858 [Geodia barretti]